MDESDWQAGNGMRKAIIAGLAFGVSLFGFCYFFESIRFLWETRASDGSLAMLIETPLTLAIAIFLAIAMSARFGVAQTLAARLMMVVAGALPFVALHWFSEWASVLGVREIPHTRSGFSEMASLIADTLFLFAPVAILAWKL